MSARSVHKAIDSRTCFGLQADEQSNIMPSASPTTHDMQVPPFADDTDGISPNQRVVGQRLLDRILILTKTALPLALGDDK